MTAYILLHSSKTMKADSPHTPLGEPQYLDKARQLAHIWQHTPADKIKRLMKVSESKAEEVVTLFSNWSTDPNKTTPAIDSFAGDIYSGLQTHTWNNTMRALAHRRLIILSGLYGALRACDGVVPYRLEMGYKLPNNQSMYMFWSDTLVSSIPTDASLLVNLSAVEYTKALLPHITIPVITPKFLTYNPDKQSYVFVVVHAKIARGAFAKWMLAHDITSASELNDFDQLGYRYDNEASTPNQPVFICEQFTGIGMSVRTLR